MTVPQPENRWELLGLRRQLLYESSLLVAGLPEDTSRVAAWVSIAHAEGPESAAWDQAEEYTRYHVEEATVSDTWDLIQLARADSYANRGQIPKAMQHVSARLAKRPDLLAPFLIQAARKVPPTIQRRGGPEGYAAALRLRATVIAERFSRQADEDDSLHAALATMQHDMGFAADNDWRPWEDLAPSAPYLPEPVARHCAISYLESAASEGPDSLWWTMFDNQTVRALDDEQRRQLIPPLVAAGQLDRAMQEFLRSDQNALLVPQLDRFIQALVRDSRFQDASLVAHRINDAMSQIYALATITRALPYAGSDEAAI